MKDFLEKLLYDSKDAILNESLNYKFFLYSSLLILLFQIVLFVTLNFGNKKEKDKIKNYKEHTKSIILYNFYNFLIAIGINVILILLVKTTTSIIFCPIIGFMLAKYIMDNILKITIVEPIKSDNKNNEKKEDKQETKQHHDEVLNENNINININNNIEEHNKKNDDVVMPYFSPNPETIKIPEGYTIKTLDLMTILELYGYISQNQKYKVISSSIFDLPEKQIEKMTTIPVLTEEELKEAKVIFNLIKLKNKIVSKEEALKYIFEKELEESNNKELRNSKKNKKEEK